MNAVYPIGYSQGRESIPTEAWGRMAPTERAAIVRAGLSERPSYASECKCPPFGSNGCPRDRYHRGLKIESRVGGGGVVLCLRCITDRHGLKRKARARRVVLGVLA